jgi:glc operon protein GlcG
MPLTIQEAQTVIEGAHRHAVANGWRVTIAVVDEGGMLQALARMDGAPPLSAQIAEAKAVGAAVWQRDGDSLFELQSGRPAFFEQISRLTRLPILAALGSVLIRRGDAVLGAVGVSGARPEEDKECALRGLAEI